MLRSLLFTARALGRTLFRSPCTICQATESPQPICSQCTSALSATRWGVSPLHVPPEPELESTNEPACRFNVLWRETYGGLLTQAIYRAKYGHDWGAAHQLGLRLADMPQLWGCSPLLVPIPLSSQRLAQRGYNQSLCIARAAGRAWGLPVQPRALRKTRQTERQAALALQSRTENLRFAFQARDTIAGHEVLLIDDIMTTGATLREAARAIRSAGGRVIGAAVVAHVHRDLIQPPGGLTRVKRRTR